MKLKLLDIRTSEQTLVRLSRIELPFKTAYRLKKLIQKVKVELDFINEKHIELVKKYGEADENNGLSVTDANKEVFFKEFNEMLQTEVEIDNLQRIDLDMLENIKLSPQELIDIDIFIQEPTQELAK